MVHFTSHVQAIGLVVVSWGVNVVFTDKPEECKCVKRDECRDWAIGPRFVSIKIIFIFSRANKVLYYFICRKPNVEVRILFVVT
jgi:hypothetical protein